MGGSETEECGRQRRRGGGSVYAAERGGGKERDIKLEEKKVGMAAIAEFFCNYHNEKKRLADERGEGCGAEEVDGKDDSEGVYSQDKQLPCCEGVCVEVLRRSVHHMSHSSPSVRLQVLDAGAILPQALQAHKVNPTASTVATSTITIMPAPIMATPTLNIVQVVVNLNYYY